MLPVAERFCRAVEEVTGETVAADPPTVRDKKGVFVDWAVDKGVDRVIDRVLTSREVRAYVVMGEGVRKRMRCRQACQPIVYV